MTRQDALKLLKEALIQKYGENIVGIFKQNGVEDIALKFDELEIVNSSNKKTYIIKDIYFVFCNSEYNEFIALKAIRGKWTLKEKNYGYIHSHVEPIRSEGSTLRRFCVGTSPFGMINYKLVNLLKKQETGELENNSKVEDSDIENLITALIVAFDQMIRVESISGGPYLRFSTISDSKICALRPKVSQLYCNSIYPLAYTEIPEEYLENLGTFIDYLKTVDLDSYPYRSLRYSFAYTFIKNEFGVGFENGRSSEYPKSIKDFYFNNKLVKAEITDDINESERVSLNLYPGDVERLYFLALLYKQATKQNEQKL